jgi:thiol-disulfide isomerase/thioredoxin
MTIHSALQHRRTLSLVTGFLLAASLVCCTRPAGATDTLSDFTAFSFIDNREIITSEMRGKIMVLVFGSIYCKPCIELLPHMNTLHARYGSGDVRILCLDIDTAVDPALQQEFIGRHGIKPPYITNALHIARSNKVFMLPTTLIVDRDGRIVKRIYGYKKLKVFESALKKLCPLSMQPESGAQPVDEPDQQESRH